MNPRIAIEQVDGPLLVALQLLLETGSVTVAARRAGSSQPNMSRILARLRVLFGDPLLEPVGRRMQTTPFARDLRPRVDHTLTTMRQLFEPAGPRSPQNEQRLVRIAASDYATTMILQPRLRMLRAEAPGIRVRVEAVSSASIDPLARGDLDLAIAPRVLLEGMDQFVFRKVLVDRLVCVFRKGHPLAPKKLLTLERYLSFEHVTVGNERPAPSAIDVALHRLDKTRSVVLTVPTFSSALTVATESDLVAALPESFVKRLGRGVVSAPLPLALDRMSLNLIWHPRRTNDPIHRWLRGSLAS